MLIGNAVERLLSSLTFRGALGLPTVCGVNHKEVGEITVCTTPLPDNVAVCGLLDAASVTVSVPVSTPRMLGVYVTKMVHLLLATTLLPHVLVWAKSPLVVTLIAKTVL
jgi:hypothetical protein